MATTDGPITAFDGNVNIVCKYFGLTIREFIDEGFIRGEIDDISGEIRQELGIYAEHARIRASAKRLFDIRT